MNYRDREVEMLKDPLSKPSSTITVDIATIMTTDIS